MQKSNWNTALILSGGGARAAYQVGVLRACAEILPSNERNPFGIICGTSAGAMNAAALASRAHHFGRAVRRIELVWANCTCEQVYHTDTWSVLGNGLRWLAAFLFPRIHSSVPVSLLNNMPLRMLLRRVMRFEKIEAALDSGNLHALCITASGYTSGESVSFFQATQELKNWRRPHRIGVRTRIGLEHLMASSAIPALFPAVRINREFFGDGAIRQLAPISPALHLGAERVLVIGVSANLNKPRIRNPAFAFPSHAQIAGHILNSAFIDALEADVQVLERLNRVLSLVPEEAIARHHPNLKPVDLLLVSPSEPLDGIAARHRHRLPRSLRPFFREGDGTEEAGGASVLSYLLFEQEYCKELIELGYHDAMQRRQELEAFLHPDEEQIPAQ